MDRNSVKLVDESSVVVQNTGLNLEGLDEKAVVDQRVFSPNAHSSLCITAVIIIVQCNAQKIYLTKHRVLTSKS